MLNKFFPLQKTFSPITKKRKLISMMKMSAVVSALGLICMIALGVMANVWVSQSTHSQIYTVNTLPQTYQVAIVLGAEVYSNGGLSSMTKDRCDRAVELYQKKKVKELLISGDHGSKNYDEVNTMKNYILKQGVPPESIFLDHAGFNTYSSIYRAKTIFQAQSAVVVSQAFHLPRALFIANNLHLQAVGVSADIQNYGNVDSILIREKLAVVKAILSVVLQSKPKYLGEVIPLTGDSKKSWDQDH